MNQSAKIIFKKVCETLNVPEEKVLSKTRKRNIVDARFLCVYFIKQKSINVTLVTIGEWFKRPTKAGAHSFVIYGIKQTEALMKANIAFKEKYLLCKNALFYINEMNFFNIPQY